MTEKLKQKIKELSVNLPKETQDAISIFDWGSITEEIGKNYLLNESEVNDLQIITGLVLVGLLDSDSYAINIENEVGTTKEDAGKISDQIIERIFKPIADNIEENIKEKIKSDNLTWNENLNFILSGGDYSIFLDKRKLEDSGIERSSNINNLSNSEDIKGREKFAI